jgi:hypothetical protein
MLTHIVTWKYRAEVPQATREEHVAKLRSLSSRVPEIEGFSVGFDILHLSRSYNSGLLALFPDQAAFEAYTFIPIT